MKLIDALKEIGNDSNKFAVNKINTKILGIRYCKEKDDVIDCNRVTGEYVADHLLLIWDYRMLDSDGWEIKTVVRPKYKIGDRFLLNDLFQQVAITDGSSSTTISKSVIGKIITYYNDASGHVLYTVSTGGITFPLILTEECLEKLDMVVSQE